jgi:hypothetical protein
VGRKNGEHPISMEASTEKLKGRKEDAIHEIKQLERCNNYKKN